MDMKCKILIAITLCIIKELHISLAATLPINHRIHSSNDSHLSQDGSENNTRLLDSFLGSFIARTLNASRYEPIPCEFCNTSSGGVQPALLDYENETIINKLEEITTEPVVDLPPDVYEVSFVRWIENPEQAQSLSQQERRGTNAQSIIAQALRNSGRQEEAHSNRVRHGSSHILHRRSRTAVGQSIPNEPIINLPVENLNQDILNMLRRQESTSGPLNLLRNKERFNMTVDYQESFQNVGAPTLLEIVLIMRSDCTLLPKRIVRWVSGRKGILFECENGAWVVRYLQKRKRKPRPVSIQDCHEIHLRGELGSPSKVHKVVIEYRDKERKSYDVLCKHNSKHTNHQLIDNHINTNLEGERQQRIKPIAGAWTVVQRRINGSVKFYRSMKRYKRGFGKVEQGEYWLGLDALHEMTHLRKYMLRIEMTMNDNRTYYSEYDNIRVGSEAKHFRLKLGNFIQPEEGQLSSGDFMSLHNRGNFYARDSEDFPVNCAKLYGTAFWFRGCWTAVNLNGPYVKEDVNNAGVRWATANPEDIRRVWKTEMLIKPIL